MPPPFFSLINTEWITLPPHPPPFPFLPLCTMQLLLLFSFGFWFFPCGFFVRFYCTMTLIPRPFHLSLLPPPPLSHSHCNELWQIQEYMRVCFFLRMSSVWMSPAYICVYVFVYVKMRKKKGGNSFFPQIVINKKNNLLLNFFFFCFEEHSLWDWF